jgi:hypothetical protein
MNRGTATRRRGSIYGPPGPWRAAVLTWVRTPAWDLAAVAVPLGWLLLGAIFNWPTLLTEVERETRRVLFQTLTTLAATLAGFVLTSISILVNLLRTPLSSLDELITVNEKRRVGAVFFAALPALTVTFLAALAALLGDSIHKTGTPLIEAVLIAAATAALSAIVRIVWVLRRLLNLTNAGAGSTGQ